MPITELYKIQYQLNELTAQELMCFVSLYNIRHNFQDQKLQREIGFEKLKMLVYKFLKKQIKIESEDSKKIRKILIIMKKTKKQLPEVVNKNYNMLKHMTKYIPEESLKVILLKVLFLLEKEFVTADTIINDIKHIKTMVNLTDQENDVYDIINMVIPKRKYLRPGQKRKQTKVNEIVIDNKLSNQIYNQILKKKNEIFIKPNEEEKDEQENIFDKQLLKILNKNIENEKKHIYLKQPSFEQLNQFKKYCKFLLKIKEKANTKLDNIIRDVFFSLFDDHHLHIDYLLNNPDKITYLYGKKGLPFQYEDNDMIYVIKSTILDYFSFLKYDRLFDIIDYFIEFIIERDYHNRFADLEMKFYFANLKGLLRKLQYNRKSKELKTIFTITLRNDNTLKKKKRRDRKLKYFDRYTKYIDFEEINLENIAKNKEGTAMLDIYVMADEIKLKEFIKKNYPNKIEKWTKFMTKKGIKTLYQYKTSKYYKEPKGKTVVKEEVKSVKNPIIHNNVMKYVNFEYLNGKPDVRQQSLLEKIENIKYQLDIMNFKTLLGLSIENRVKQQKKFEKMLFELNDNNKNSMLVNHMESNICILETKFKQTNNEDEKSKIRRQIKTLESKLEMYKQNIKDVNAFGYSYGTNFEEPIYGNQYITQEIIDKTKKMQATMDMLDKITKRKMENVRLSNFAIDMLNNYEYVNNDLFKIFDMYVNHNIDTMVENYLIKNSKLMKKELKNFITKKHEIKDYTYDLSRIIMTIFFIIQNEDNVDKFYQEQHINMKLDYVNKYVKYQNKYGRVLDENINQLVIQFGDLSVEMIDKNLVEIIPSFVNRNVIIQKGPYKGFLGRIYKHAGDKVMLTIDSYGMSRENSCPRVPRITLKINEIKLQDNFRTVTLNGKTFYIKVEDHKIQNKTVAPRNKENKDLFSITRFLFNQVTRNIDDKEIDINDMYFTNIYKLALRYVNDIIYENEIKFKNLKAIKDTNEKVQVERQYIKEGMIKMSLSKSMFRTTKRDEIILLKDNSTDYKDEAMVLIRFSKIPEQKVTPEQEKENKDNKRQEKIQVCYDKFKSAMKGLNLSF